MTNQEAAVRKDIASVAERVNQELTALEKKLSSATDVAEHDMLSHSFALMRAGGKRLRPWLVIAAAEMFGRKRDDMVVQLSLVPELLHAYLLIHDDVMDHSQTRRGEPTVHERFRATLSTLPAGNDAPESLAILAGDYLATLVSDHLLALELTGEQKDQALRHVSRALRHTIRGQALDIALSLKPSAQESDILAMYEYKTAYYSLLLPLQLGALIAGTREAELPWLTAFAQVAGRAFQIQDDLLGVYGDETVTGKSTSSDIREGKMTLLRTYGDTAATVEQQEELQVLLGNAAASESEVARVKEIWLACGAKDKAEAVAEQLFKEAEDILTRAEQDTSLLGATLAILRERGK